MAFPRSALDMLPGNDFPPRPFCGAARTDVLDRVWLHEPAAIVTGYRRAVPRRSSNRDETESRSSSIASNIPACLKIDYRSHQQYMMRIKFFRQSG
jgi:hypothetical protein